MAWLATQTSEWRTLSSPTSHWVLHRRFRFVEVDGGQHLDSVRDMTRDQWLEAQGFRVLRFWNHDVLLRTREVLEAIWHALR